MMISEAHAWVLTRSDDFPSGTGFVWLGLFEPSPEELERVREAFGLHALAIEDAQTFHLRPKVERYDGGFELAVMRTARYDDEREEIDTGEISVFLGENFVITVRKGVASELHGARIRLEKHPELLRTGSASVLWAILDQMVDCYGPVMAQLDRDIEQIEATVFSGSAAPTERIYFLRREVTDFYRAVHPLLAVLASQVQPKKWPAELLPYLRGPGRSYPARRPPCGPARGPVGTASPAIPTAGPQPWPGRGGVVGDAVTGSWRRQGWWRRLVLHPGIAGSAGAHAVAMTHQQRCLHGLVP
jgi:hypothetical protein